MGAAAADALLAGYYARLQDEYKDRRRVAAVAELAQLERQLEDETLAGIEKRRIERKIRARRLLLG
jgi:hypothetical protein